MNCSPSSAWAALPIKFRIIALLTGFLFVYYGVFGKHHYYDREISSIHTDIEKLMRDVNKTGFIPQNFVEAELPEIFRENADLKRTTPTPLPPKEPDKKVGKKEKPAAIEKSVSSSTNTTSSGPGLPLKKKKKKEKKKGKDKKSAETGDKDSIKDTARPADSESEKPDGKAVYRNQEDQKPTGLRKADTDISLPSTSAQQVSSGGDVRNEDSNPADQTSLDTSEKSAAGPTSAPTLPSSNTTNQDTSNTPSSSVPSADGSHSSTNEASETSHSDPIVADVSGNPPSGPESIEMLPEELHSYEKEFRDLDVSDVPEGHVPVLTWNYKSVLDKDLPEHIFGLGNKLDHVAVYKPLCIDTTTEKAFSFRGETICSGFNRTYGWLVQYCSVMKETLRKEYLLDIQRETQEKSWLEDNASSIQWVEGLTVLQVLEKNCGNIAHFAGRILLLEHIINNIQAYAAPPSLLMNILVVPTFHIMKRFQFPHNYEFWHKTLFNALIAPSQYIMGTLGDFLSRDSKPRVSRAPLVHLLHNMSTENGPDASKKYVCFRRALIPGYLKARFFINDVEYPSKFPSLQSTAKDAPTVPRDSLRMREKVSALVDSNPQISKRRKEIVLLDRTGSRRVFGPEAREQVLGMINKVAEEKGYTFNITSFDKMRFEDQYAIMKKVSIAVGIHGANLVNTMFMPPLSALIELFPFGFKHEMYMNGGNAGLKYYSYQMKNGEQFKGPKVYRSVEQCIRFSKECKMHYRDAALQVEAEDLAEMERILRKGIAWCDSLQGNEDAAGGSGSSSRRRRRRRRRLLNRKKVTGRGKG